MVPFAVPAIAVTLRAGLPILFPEQLQRQMLMGLKLLTNSLEIDVGQLRPNRPGRAGWEQKSIELLVVQILRQGPFQTDGRRPLQVPMNRSLPDRATSGDLFLLQSDAVAQAQHLPEP